METSTKVENEDEWKRFKSYYVVWKLQMKNKKKQKGHRFKSYYVVWKLPSKTSANKGVGSLNRTMQYGNNEVKTACELLCRV